MLTGQVAPPAERYNLREDLRAWVAAVRGLRENPLVTHLRLAEQRRLKRIPRWRRSLLVIITAIGLAAAFTCLLPVWLAMYGTPAPLVTINLFAIAACILAIVWFMQGVFNCVVGALGVLGRYNKGSAHLCIDDSACLSSLTDHEIVTGAVSVLLPPLLWRVAYINLGIFIFPAWFWLYKLLNQQYTMLPPSHGFLLAIMIYAWILIIQVSLFGIPGITGLILYFLCLGRGLETSSISTISGTCYALGQGIHPLLLAAIIWDIDRGSFHYYGVDGLLVRILFLMLLLFPAIIVIALGMSRRNSTVRYLLALLSPIILWMFIWPSTLLLYRICDVNNDVVPSAFLESTAHALALSSSSISILSPILLFDPSGIGDFFNADIGPGVKSWLREHSLIMSLRLLYVFIIQAVVLNILSRFAREAVRARRSRGD